MRGLVRLLVVGFTVLSLLIVAAVGVAAGSGKSGAADNVKKSVVAVFAGHLDQVGVHGNSANGPISASKEGKDKDKDKECKPPKKVHKHGTPGHKHHPCGDDDEDSD
jgi:hypothetical protein